MRHIWAIEPEYAHVVTNDIINSLAHKGTIDIVGMEKLVSVNESVLLASSGAGKTTATGGQVAVISISGPMMKNDQFCGPKGTASIAEMIKAADADPKISGIVLSIDSPGGTVDGTETLGNVIKSTKKPIVGFADGMAASAGYWVLSQCDEVMLNGKTASVGSIGVCMNFYSVKDAMQKAGIVEHFVTATDSVDKQKSYRDILNNGDATAMIAELDKYNAVFKDTVQSGRGDKVAGKENVFTGKMYTGKEAIKVGLADSIGTLQDAVNNAATKIYSKKKSNMKATAIMNLLNWQELPVDAKETGISLQPMEIEAVETALVETATLRETVTEQTATIEANTATIAQMATDHAAALEAVTAQLTAANSSLANVTAERDTLAKRTVPPTDAQLDEEETNKPKQKSTLVDDGFPTPVFRK